MLFPKRLNDGPSVMEIRPDLQKRIGARITIRMIDRKADEAGIQECTAQNRGRVLLLSPGMCPMEHERAPDWTFAKRAIKPSHSAGREIHSLNIEGREEIDVRQHEPEQVANSNEGSGLDQGRPLDRRLQAR